ncbi:unnamed protein product [Hydatigera taeniaeformis]|uniref:Ectonucleotide pyrophosphatase/phosphodiesterase family member 5 n=1 Tax=Hydatigena taeniaeformis TaxID=6205 RepID=A0A0R3X207_HYDTA|nr:unnamed protein product [Hydatigera taeniaeformis]
MYVATFCMLWALSCNFGLVRTFGRNEKEKLLLISAEYIPLGIFEVPEANFSTFRTLMEEGCLIPNISINNFSTSAEIHSILLSGGLYQGSHDNRSRILPCDKILFSKILPHFEPLWLTNQRHGLHSASFFWPDDHVAVNNSRPFLTAGIDPDARTVYFDVDRIHRWLLNPSITFLSIFIPCPYHGDDSNFIFDYVEYADAFLFSLLSRIKSSPKLSSLVNIVLIGGTAAVDAQSNDEIVPIRKYFRSWPASAFSNHFNRGRFLEFWPTPGEEDADMVRLLTEENDDFFVCNTAEFQRRFSRFNMGLLPPYYLVAKPGKVLQISDTRGSETSTNVNRLSAFALLWGNAFISADTSSICGLHNQSTITLHLADIYPLVCWVLHLPRPWLHWGNLARVTRLLSQPPFLSQVKEFERRSRAWTTLPIGIDSKLAVSKETFLTGGLISAFVVIFGIVFAVCAIKVHRRYHRTSGGGDNFGRVRYHRRRIPRPWLAPSTSPYVLRNQRLLSSSTGGHSNEATEEEEEVLISNDALTRSRRRDDAEAFIQMLHSPSESSMPRTMPALSGA